MAKAASNGNRIVIGADHAGFGLKKHLKEYLEDKGFEVIDIGCRSTDSVDYPKIGYSLAMAMRDQDIPKGVLACGSGIGVSIAANRFPHVRSVVARDITDAQLSRRHNDSNVICFGGRLTAPELAMDILDAWLETPFEGGRHANRTQMLDFSPQECAPFTSQEAPRSC